MYNEDAYKEYDHHEQGSTNEVEPASAHTPGSRPPRMDSEVELSGAVRQELSEADYFPALYSDDLAAQNGCGCGQKPKESEGCGCGDKSRQGDR